MLLHRSCPLRLQFGYPKIRKKEKHKEDREAQEAPWPLRACTCTRRFLWWSAPPPLTLPNNGTLFSCGPRPPPRFPLLWRSSPPPHSPAHGKLLLSPSGWLYKANPSPHPRTDLWSLSLSAQAPPKHLRLWCPRWWCTWSAWLLLCFALLSPAAVIFMMTLRSLHLGSSLHQLGGFPGCGFLFSFIAPCLKC